MMLFAQLVAFSQSKYAEYNSLILQFGKAENFEDAEKTFAKIKQFSCPVAYYPTLALWAINDGNREEALRYLADAMRFGYSVTEMETSHPNEYKRFTELSIDSISAHIRNSKTIAFDWQAYIQLNSIFNGFSANRTLAHVDSNARKLVIPLRTLMYSYMRKHGFPSDCQVGFGMSNSTKQCILTTSRFLLDFEFNELDKMLQMALDNYQITLDYYAFIVDYYLFCNGETSRYGSLKKVDSQGYKTYVKENLVEINTQRKNLGLPELTKRDAY